MLSSEDRCQILSGTHTGHPVVILTSAALKPAWLADAGDCRHVEVISVEELLSDPAGARRLDDARIVLDQLDSAYGRELAPVLRESRFYRLTLAYPALRAAA